MIRDAFWQIFWRIISAACGFAIVLFLAPYLDPGAFWDYNTIIKYFVLWSALSEFWLYVIWLTKLRLSSDSFSSSPISSLPVWSLWDTWKKQVLHRSEQDPETIQQRKILLTTRVLLTSVVFLLALIVAYFIPEYTNNPYILYWLPFAMIFSASVMLTNVVQLPLQLHRRMHHASIAITLSRVVQLALTIAIIVAFPVFSMTSWLWIMLVTALSGVLQCVYTAIRAHRYLPLRLHWHRASIRELLRENISYGIAHFLWSFQAVLILWLLSLLYPTIDGYVIVWLRALALAFYEILLVVPLSLANSFVHSIDIKHLSCWFWALSSLFLWLWAMIWINVFLFSRDIISLVPDTSYLSSIYAPVEFLMTWQQTYGLDFLLSSFLPALWLIILWWWALFLVFSKKISLTLKTIVLSVLFVIAIVYSFFFVSDIRVFDTWVIGSDMILVFMMPALWFHFGKQLWHYVLVKSWRDRSLLPLNMIWIIIGVSVALFWIYQWWVMWALFAHAFLEASLWIITMIYARSVWQHISVAWWKHLLLIVFFVLVWYGVSSLYQDRNHDLLWAMIVAIWLNIILCGVSYSFLKNVVKELKG